MLARLFFPASKLKTTEYLAQYEGYHTNEDRIYRYLDKLVGKLKRRIQQISYDHTVSVLGAAPQVVFYDVTTLYFEIEDADERGLRAKGFSKDGKPQNPQIVLGLLVSKGGYPLAYELFRGNKFEGFTMIPVLNFFRRKYKLQGLVVVADSGMLSKANMTALEEGGYSYILGARLRNETKAMQKRILSGKPIPGKWTELDKGGGRRLIITSSEKRAAKDRHNRQKGVARLEQMVKSGKLTKERINNRGYNRFLNMSGKIDVAIDVHKVEEDAQWDGLKGYLTNTSLTAKELVSAYEELWRIEYAFRISKSDIKIRPVFHQLPERIEAHITLCFVAYKIYKELERRLAMMDDPKISVLRALELAKVMYQISYTLPTTGEKKWLLIAMQPDQNRILDAIKI